jgi:ATP-dependent helicase HepA
MVTNDYIPGQRWISDAELQMGLGTILASEHRTVTVHYPATDETRTYAKQTAPLTRVIFAIGDSVKSQDGWSLTVSSVSLDEGILTYFGIRDDGEDFYLVETELNNLIQLNRPSERLFSGQIDKDKWFELRYQTLLQLNRLAHSNLRGLTGTRTSLIPHQLYIAHEVANRYAPRVLLADEVGLGKTIEAGLILHHQLLTERARRVLIVVPESLVHQWLVEMLRRFNLHFSVFNEERCLDIEEGDKQQNPFQTEQLVLCHQEFLTSNPARFKQALAGEWDLLVVDEAHHLKWSPTLPSLEYELIEKLAAQTKGVLLLTATPEQLGKESHFARLRLLDPDRFPDYDAFIEEEKSYQPIAQAVDILLNNNSLNNNDLSVIKKLISSDENKDLLNKLKNQQDYAENSIELIEHLLDRHGTGRVLFRNTRSAVKGFPRRKLNSYPLEQPADYTDIETDINNITPLLCPETTLENNTATEWTKIDPRIHWLTEKLKQLHPEKVLVIAAHASTALDIAQHLKMREGLHAAVFHEGLSIVERDRAAAFFADDYDGAQVLICSEIGSEGRNFQFAHHLVLFDLPLNPDLLEQRIGRLDRIGQDRNIELHVPYLLNSAQETLLHWYHEGLNAFEQTCPAGHNVFTQVKEELLQSLQSNSHSEELVTKTRILYNELNTAMQNGRDRLLEFNSCRRHIAETLKEDALKQDATNSLPQYMEKIYDCFGINSEDQSNKKTIIEPGDHMLANFPGLHHEGMTITYDRNTALENEDIHYINWEHPLVVNAMDMILSQELGNSALTAVEYKKVQAGSILLECLFILESASNEALQSARYLPPTTIRIVLDEKGRDHDSLLPHFSINKTQTLVDTGTAKQIIHAKDDVIRHLLKQCENLAQTQSPDILANAHKQTQQTLQLEINRLTALTRVNPNIRKEEIHFFEKQLKALTEVLESATLRLDAVRVIIAT